MAISAAVPGMSVSLSRCSPLRRKSVEFEKATAVAAPIADVWRMLLDPHVMGACVPGMESIDVVSQREYVVLMHVKVSFVAARFKVRTRIVEARAPVYLRSEGAGEDSTLANTLKHASEVFLSQSPNGET